METRDASLSSRLVGGICVTSGLAQNGQSVFVVPIALLSSLTPCGNIFAPDSLSRRQMYAQRHDGTKLYRRCQKGHPHRRSAHFWTGLAPRAGLEPATSRLQVLQSFDWTWTISSPAWHAGEGVGRCRGLIGWVPQPLVSARSCLHMSLRLCSGQALRQVSLRITIPNLTDPGQASLNSPDVSTAVIPRKLQTAYSRLLYQLSYRGTYVLCRARKL